MTRSAHGSESWVGPAGSARVSDAPDRQVGHPEGSPPTRLVCREVWGGNRAFSGPIELPGLVGKIHSQPCTGGRGGDIHYLSVCDSGLVCQIVLADVVGHGEDVAAVSGTIHGLLRRYLNRLDQRRVLVRLNRRLEKVGFQALTTAVAVNYFPPWRRLSVSYAGHPGAWLYRSSLQAWSSIDTDNLDGRMNRPVNLPLATDARTVFTRRTVKIDHGDRLLVLTDGVLEAPDKAGQILGCKQFKAILDRVTEGTPSKMVDGIIESLTARAGSTGLAHDDMTLLLVEFVPGPPGPILWHAIKNRLGRLGRLRGQRSSVEKGS
jgi:hypothetical protein